MTPEAYAKRLERSVTIRPDTRTLEYFQGLAAELEVPYQTLINLYLRDCAETGRRPAMRWRPPRTGAAWRTLQQTTLLLKLALRARVG